MKLTQQQIKKLKRHGFLSLFIILLIASFIFLNSASGLLFSTHKLDLTKDKRYTLRPETVQILQNLPHQITINIYYSNSISKDYPLYSQYAQLVLRTLDRYQDISKNQIKINLLDPKPYTSTEEDAIRYGLRKFSNIEGETGYYFGAVMINSEGKKYTIPYFQSQRQDYLENDITRGISALGTFNHRNIGIMSPDIPMIDTSYRGRKANQDWTFIKLLRQDYNIVEISPTIAEIPLEIETLILITTSKLPANSAYVIDQFVMRGGKLLVMIDPHSIYEDKIKGLTSPDGSDINILLQKWGINYGEDLIVGDKELSHYITFPNGSTKKFYPAFNLNNSTISTESILTQEINNIFVQTPGGLELVETPDITTTPLLQTTNKSVIIDAKISKFGTKEDVINNTVNMDSPVIISALSQGTYQSAFQNSPFSSEIMSEILPHISSSIIPSKIIVITDVDWIYQQSWVEPPFLNGNTTDEIVPLNNNFDFLIRSVDYLTSNEKSMSIGSKPVSNRDNTLGQRIEEITSKRYADNYQELQKDFETTKVKLNTISMMIKNQEINVSIKKLSEMNEIQRTLQKKQEQMQRLEYKIKENSQTMIDMIITVNTIIFPILIMGFIILIVFILRYQKQKRAERIVNE